LFIWENRISQFTVCGPTVVNNLDYMLMSYNKWIQYSGPGYCAHFAPLSGLVIILVSINIKSVYKWFLHHNENATKQQILWPQYLKFYKVFYDFYVRVN
jgi:hypothetical protein